MLKARIWIIDDSDPKVDKVFDHFDMAPSEEWKEGVFCGDIWNYRFSFTFTRLIEKAKSDRGDLK